MVGAADEQQSAKTAYRAGEDHGADDDLVHLDTDVARGAFTLADNGDLIAVLGVIQIEIHQNRDERDNEDIQKIFIASDLRKPADLGGLVDDADLVVGLYTGINYETDFSSGTAECLRYAARTGKPIKLIKGER